MLVVKLTDSTDTIHAFLIAHHAGQRVARVSRVSDQSTVT